MNKFSEVEEIQENVAGYTPFPKFYCLLFRLSWNIMHKNIVVSSSLKYSVAKKSVIHFFGEER